MLLENRTSSYSPRAPSKRAMFSISIPLNLSAAGATGAPRGSAGLANLAVPKLSTFICGRRSSRPLRPQHRSVLSIAVGGESLNASKPSISGEQPNNGTPSFRKARSSSTPRESANVKPCRSRHTRFETLAVVTILWASSTHAPSSFPWKLIDKRVIGTGSVMSSNAWTPESLRLHRRW